MTGAANWFGRNLRSCIARGVLAAVLASPLVPARAVIYASTFDPLDFFGTATFDVDAACLTSDGFKLNDGTPCAVSWLDASVTLVALPGGETLTYTYAAFLPSASAVVGIDVLLGDLAGVFSMLIGPVVIAGEPIAEFNGSFSLMFSGDLVSLFKDGKPVGTAAAAFFRVPGPGGLASTLAALCALGAVRLARGRRARGLGL